MTTLSFTPLMRQTVGFDRFNDLFETMLREPEKSFEPYPPYNIEKMSEDDYRITMAVAGFSGNDLNITVKDDQLTIQGAITDREDEQEKAYLHRGIATRNFERNFRLADHIKVVDAGLEDGLLSVVLKREVPEEKKPRLIPISTSNGKKGLLGSSKN
tara:strand:+ start:90 stop:560 length:471 start_codon:yes stop_codon:yes gene_type:complete